MLLGVLVGMRIKEQGTRSEEAVRPRVGERRKGMRTKRRGMGKMEEIREMGENG